MNNRQLENKIDRDVAEVQKDVRILLNDSADQLGEMGENVVKAADSTKEDLSMWVRDTGSQISKKVEKLTNDIKGTLTNTAETIKEDVNQGLTKYNAKAQEVADKIPGDFSRKVAKYPWVVISIALAVGFLLGSIFKPARRILV